MKKNGFTLAEVLITLTIIGVIAAITIPNLMQSWRKHERITQIKSAYSIIQNATRMAVAEHGNPDGWDFSGENRGNAAIRTYSKYYFVPYVKVQLTCQDNAQIFNDKCFANNRWYKLNGDDFGNGPYGISYMSQYKLQNGMNIAIWAPQKSLQYNRRDIVFLVDVDGAKGPTTLGKDIFTFIYNLDTGKFYTGGNTLNYNTNDCITTDAGSSCAYWIERNHWEFPDDYPVKKF